MKPGLTAALKLMRIPFSVFLMPVFWFAVSQIKDPAFIPAIIVFIILHIFVYPASNGYNSYFDCDESSIGGLKNPPAVTRELFYLVIAFDILAVLCSLFISLPFAVLVFTYLMISKAYSYDKIRLKKYPLTSTAVVVSFQGAFTFLTVQVGIGMPYKQIIEKHNLLFAFVSSLFLLGSYPLTQVYQHEEDGRRGDETLSRKLGVQGTFIFSGIAFAAATALLVWLYYQEQLQIRTWIYLIVTFPVILFFSLWLFKIRKDPAEVNFENTMKLNATSSLCLSAGFILMILLT